MLKKLAKLLRILIIGAIWTYLFLIVANFFMRAIWNFDLFSPASWKFLSAQWDKGGKIVSAKDYIFATCLLAILPLWIYGWKLSLRVSPIKVLFFPVLLYDRFIGSRGIDDTPRITFKNVETSKKVSLEELIDARMPKAKENQNANDIRQAVHEKISQAKD